MPVNANQQPPLSTQIWNKCTTEISRDTSALSPEKAVSVLLKVVSAIQNQRGLTFKPTVINQPEEGTVVLISAQPGSRLPEDGFGWLDEEHVRVMQIPSGPQITVATRAMGFLPNSQTTSITRTRYALKDSPYQLVQWTSTQTNFRKPLANVRPVVNPRIGQPRGIEVISAEKRKGQLAEGEAEGDEFDNLKAIDIALARYKRNHDMIEEIFSIYPIKSITPPPQFTNVTKENYQSQLESLEKRKAELKKSIEDGKKEFEERIKKSNQTRDRAMKQLDAVRNVNTVKDLETNMKTMEEILSIKFRERTHNYTTVLRETM